MVKRQALLLAARRAQARGHLNCSVPTWCDVLFCGNSLAVRETHPKTPGLPRIQTIPPTCPLKLRHPQEKADVAELPWRWEPLSSPAGWGTLLSQRMARGATSPLRTPGHCFRSRHLDSTSACQGCPKGTAGAGVVVVCNLGCRFREAGTLMPFISQMRGLRQGRPHEEQWPAQV